MTSPPATPFPAAFAPQLVRRRRGAPLAAARHPVSPHPPRRPDAALQRQADWLRQARGPCTAAVCATVCLEGRTSPVHSPAPPPALLDSSLCSSPPAVRLCGDRITPIPRTLFSTLSPDKGAAPAGAAAAAPARLGHGPAAAFPLLPEPPRPHRAAPAARTASADSANRQPQVRLPSWPPFFPLSPAHHLSCSLKCRLVRPPAAWRLWLPASRPGLAPNLPTLAPCLQAGSWQRELSFADLLTAHRPVAAPLPAAPRPPASPPRAAELVAEMAVTPRKRARKSLAPLRAAACEGEAAQQQAGAAPGPPLHGSCQGESDGDSSGLQEDAALSTPRKLPRWGTTPPLAAWGRRLAVAPPPSHAPAAAHCFAACRPAPLQAQVG